LILKCSECGEGVKVPDDALDGELVLCEVCGTQFMVKVENGRISLSQTGEIQEDWGE
jgi:alpha-aminoadipate carrier protein LysW